MRRYYNLKCSLDFSWHLMEKSVSDLKIKNKCLNEWDLFAQKMDGSENG